MLLVWKLILVCVVLRYCTCSGYFEIQIVSIENARGEISDGTCCGSRSNLHVDHTCRGSCDTYFKICLKQYQSLVTYRGDCTFGNWTTRVLGGNSFQNNTSNTVTTVKLPFQFLWPVRIPLHSLLFFLAFFTLFNFGVSFFFVCLFLFSLLVFCFCCCC